MSADRQARCYCGRTVPSDPNLAFFEYAGPGHDRDSCDVCGFAKCCHKLDQPDGWNHSAERPCHIVDHHYTNVEGRLFDIYYCGCRGWD